MLKTHSKKLIAPIVIAAVLFLYFIAFAIFCVELPWIPLFVKLPAGVIPLLFAGVTIYVLVERIKEIRSGEEDDLSKY